MFIHLGENIVIQAREMIAIIDGNLVDESTILREFVDINMGKKNIIKISNGSAKSIVITERNVYFSPLSTVTLKRRLQYISELEVNSE
ncbi:extracellular matrix regulator RemB [Schinkia sp. CFF1]